MNYPIDLIRLMDCLRRLPGVGSKTAERFAFHLLSCEEHFLSEFSAILSDLKAKLPPCPSCGCLMDEGKCLFCGDPTRETDQLCIIASAKEAFIVEETRIYKGLYHVIGPLLSPLDGRHPEHLLLGELKQRIIAKGVREVIIALDTTLEGDATALYLKEQLLEWGVGVKASRLAFGLPLGSSLDYVDGGTLKQALLGRQVL